MGLDMGEERRNPKAEWGLERLKAPSVGIQLETICLAGLVAGQGQAIACPPRAADATLTRQWITSFAKGETSGERTESITPSLA